MLNRNKSQEYYAKNRQELDVIFATVNTYPEKRKFIKKVNGEDITFSLINQEDVPRSGPFNSEGLKTDKIMYVILEYNWVASFVLYSFYDFIEEHIQNFVWQVNPKEGIYTPFLSTEYIGGKEYSFVFSRRELTLDPAFTTLFEQSKHFADKVVFIMNEELDDNVEYWIYDSKVIKAELQKRKATFGFQDGQVHVIPHYFSKMKKGLIKHGTF